MDDDYLVGQIWYSERREIIMVCRRFILTAPHQRSSGGRKKRAHRSKRVYSKAKSFPEADTSQPEYQLMSLLKHFALIY